MPWTLLLDLRVLLGIALVAVGAYAKVQTVRLEQAKAEFAQFRADVESEAAKAKVAAARQEALQATHAQEALDGLQVRLTAANRAYASLRSHNASSRSLPPLSEASAVPSPGPVSSQQPDPDARCVAALEWGDQQLAKYAELWKLEQANAR